MREWDPMSILCSIPGTIMTPELSQEGTSTVILAPPLLEQGGRDRGSMEWNGPLNARGTLQRQNYFKSGLPSRGNGVQRI